MAYWPNPTDAFVSSFIDILLEHTHSFTYGLRLLSGSVGPSLVINTMAKHRLILKAIDPRTHACKPWGSSVCKEILVQLRNYLYNERGPVSLQDWVLLIQNEPSLYAPPRPPTLGPMTTKYITPLPSHSRVRDLSQLECCQAVEDHPSLWEVISPSRTLPPQPLKQ